MTKQMKADLGLFLVTIGWGASFILTKNSLGELQTFNFLAIRFILAFGLSAAIFFKDMIKTDRKTLIGGLILGVVLYASFALQTMGLLYTTASKSAFVTGFSVVLVPLFTAFLSKKLPEKKITFSVVLAFVGLGLLTLNGSALGINIGDFYTLISAIIFAFYIIMVGKYTAKTQSVPLAIVQLGVVGLLSVFTTFTLENPQMPESLSVWTNIIILSVVCTSGAYIVQSVAQKYTTATHTALIYSAEPVFAAIFGYFVVGEVLNGRGLLGAGLVLTAMLLSELDLKLIFRKNIKVLVQSLNIK